MSIAFAIFFTLLAVVELKGMKCSSLFGEDLTFTKNPIWVSIYLLACISMAIISWVEAYPQIKSLLGY